MFTLFPIVDEMKCNLVWSGWNGPLNNVNKPEQVIFLFFILFIYLFHLNILYIVIRGFVIKLNISGKYTEMYK